MNKKKAVKSFEYWGNNIYTPTGRKNIKAEKMRSGWAKMIDSGKYKKLPLDSVKADDIVKKRYIK